MSTRLLFLQKDKGTQEITLEKKFINVGTEATHDIVVESSKRGLLFSLILGEDAVSLVPGDFDLRLNDKSLKSGGQIKNLDQIAWKDGKATFVQSNAFKVFLFKMDLIKVVSTEQDWAVFRVATVFQKDYTAAYKHSLFWMQNWQNGNTCYQS